ncbi:MAG: hypothetical protein OXD30_04310 [Bryobacterales bacterium]|nr:hypothetical protein [Bryobacterales bacterium]
MLRPKVAAQLSRYRGLLVSGRVLQSGEGQWQSRKRAAEQQVDVDGLAQVGDECHLGWLILHVAAQMGAPDAAA